MLDRLDDGLWTVARPIKLLGLLTVTSRMTVARLGDGGLLLHSPVRLEPALREAIDALGPVRHVIAPNRVHHMFCADYRAAYPEARLHGAPGLAAKRPDLRLDSELGDGAPEAWAGELDQAVVTGIPTLNEVAFLHRPSGTLLLTDLAAHGTPADPPPMRLWARLSGVNGRLATPLVVRLMGRDKPATRRQLDRVLGWEFDRVSVGHGAIVERDGRRLAREAFAWA